MFGFFAALVFVCYASGDNAKVKIHLDFLKTFGTALFAFLTFSTVVWRGLVGEFQAREQTRANDAKDEELRAKLTMDSINLLKSDDDAEIGAGVTALQIVATAQNSKFSMQAMDILADFVIKHHQKNPPHRGIFIAKEALKAGEETGNLSSRTIDVNCAPSSPLPSMFCGFKKVVISNATVSSYILESYKSRNAVEFKNSAVVDASIDLSISFVGCQFSKCRIESMYCLSLIGQQFDECDFSSTRLELGLAAWLPEMTKDTSPYGEHLYNCFFYRDSPPTGDGAHLILPYLEARDRPAA